MIEKHFHISFLSNLALREKQIQQDYRPVIAVHKWFARRPGTLFRGLLLSEFGAGELQDLFYKSNCLDGITVADPFMGGGTPVIEANRLGCKVIGMFSKIGTKSRRILEDAGITGIFRCRYNRHI